ncbi:MAG: hypothetical protein K2X66_02685 [Cyanobacteria bacterium]|nr:hypothetical protein [Cyanobacteriota bacterium]
MGAQAESFPGRGFSGMSLEAQVAQRFIVGYRGLDYKSAENSAFQKLLACGLGGVIFFRENFQSQSSSTPRCLSVQEIVDLLASLQSQNTLTPFPLWMSIDQEGGQIERLPGCVFPNTLSPLTIASVTTPSREILATQVYETMAVYLKALGFNMNFFPTLDLNLDPDNPIIGVRSFGDDPDLVWKLSKIALDSFEKAGIFCVGKHFPGHGNGKVDSHLKLPVLNFTDVEYSVFQQAILHNIPGMMVSHGYYPDIQPAGESFVPASASPTIIQQRLRGLENYRGLVISDDMRMGAITQSKSPLRSAIESLKAGVDVLIYQFFTEACWEVFLGVVEALKSGELDPQEHLESLSRIETAKQKMGNPQPNAPVNFSRDDRPEMFETETLKALSLSFATQALGVALPADERFHQLEQKPVEGSAFVPKTHWLVVHPHRKDIHHYAGDRAFTQELPDVLSEIFSGKNFPRVTLISYEYAPKEAKPFSPPLELPSDGTLGILLVSFNAWAYPDQKALFQKILDTYPGVPKILATIGMPTDSDIFSGATHHCFLGGYRECNMQALALWMKDQVLVPGMQLSSRG